LQLVITFYLFITAFIIWTTSINWITASALLAGENDYELRPQHNHTMLLSQQLCCSWRSHWRTNWAMGRPTMSVTPTDHVSNGQTG